MIMDEKNMDKKKIEEEDQSKNGNGNISNWQGSACERLVETGKKLFPFLFLTCLYVWDGQWASMLDRNYADLGCGQAGVGEC